MYDKDPGITLHEAWARCSAYERLALLYTWQFEREYAMSKAVEVENFVALSGEEILDDVQRGRAMRFCAS